MILMPITQQETPLLMRTLVDYTQWYCSRPPVLAYHIEWSVTYLSSLGLASMHHHRAGDWHAGSAASLSLKYVL
jgi:hypothetical protein